MSYYYGIFGWILEKIYSLVGNNYFIAIVLFTLFFRVILLPSTISQQKGSAKQMRMQAKVKRIQDKYKDYNKPDKQQLIQQEQQELYQREGYSSMTGSCLPLLIQLPVLWGLYGAVYRPIHYLLKMKDDVIIALYNAIPDIETKITEITNKNRQVEMTLMQRFGDAAKNVGNAVPKDVIATIQNFLDKDFNFLGIPLYQTPSMDTVKHFGDATTGAKLLLLIPILSCLSSLLTSAYTQIRQNKTNPQAAAQMKSMGCMTFVMMPLFSLWITFSLPAAVGIYWIISNVIGFLQMFILSFTHEPKKVLAKIMVQESIDRRSKEENLKKMAKYNDIEN